MLAKLCEQHKIVRCFYMTKVYEIQSFDATDLEKFYLQTSEQIWYVLNAKRIKNTPEKERDELWEIENKRLQTVEKKFLIHSEDGYEDIDIGYLFGLYAVLKYFAVRSLDWEEIDQEINYLVDKYRRNS